MQNMIPGFITGTRGVGESDPVAEQRTAAEWTALNPTLGDGVTGYETDTQKWKIGDGTTAWNSLGYQPSMADLGALQDNVDAVVVSLEDDIDALQAHLDDTTSPHSLTSLGLNNVDNVKQLPHAINGLTAVGSLASDDVIPVWDTSASAPRGAPVSILPIAPVQASGPELTAGTETALRGYSPANLKTFVNTHAAGSAGVSSFNSRTGAISPATNDYTAAQIAETSTAKIMTADERTKLAGIEAGASKEDPIYTETDPYSEITSAAVAPADGAIGLVLTPSIVQCLVVNEAPHACTVVAPEGIQALGANFVNDTAAGDFIDFPIASHGFPTTGIQKFTASFWIKTSTADFGDQGIVSSFVTSSNTFEIYFLGAATKRLAVRCRRSGGITAVEQRTVTLTSSQWVENGLNHVMIAVDTTVPACKIYINGASVAFVSDFSTPTLVLNETWGISTTNLRVGGRSSTTAANYPGDLYQLWLNFGTYMDPAVPANLAKFYNAGNAVNLGYNGWRPTGTPPMLFLNGSGADFNKNLARADKLAGITTGILGSAVSTIPGQSDAWTFGGGLSEYSVPPNGTGESGVRSFIQRSSGNQFMVIPGA